MPTINLTGGSGNDPKQNKGAAFAAYEKSQADAAKKTTQRDSAFDRHDKELDAQLSKLKKQEVDELKAHMAQQKQERAREAQLFRQEMAARNSHLAQEKQRENQHNQAQRILRRSEDMAARRAAKNDPQTYRLQNIEQLGRAGMRYAERNDWRGLARTEYELGHIQSRFGNSPGAAVALARARGHIRAGGEGNPGWLNRAGRMAGMIEEHGALRGGGMALGGGAGYIAGGVAGLAFQAAKMVLNSPMAINGYVQNMVGQASPSMNMRTALSAIGRSGGIDSEDLRKQLLGNSDWMRQYGTTAQGATDILGRYGIAPHTANQGVGVVRAVARTSYETGLDPGQLATMAGNASNLGMTNALNVDEYLRKVQRVTQVAVSQGMDRSQATNVLEGLYKQATTSNTATLGSGQGISDLWTRMMQAGTPSARSGASTASLIQGADAFANDITFNTGDPASAQFMGAYIQRQGGAKAFTSDAAIKKLMGADRYNNLASTPGGMESLRRVKQAAADGDVALLSHNLGPLVEGDVDTVNRIFEGSGLGNGVSSGYRSVMKERIFHTSAQSLNDFTATKGLYAGPLTATNGAKAAWFRDNNPLNLSYAGQEGSLGRDMNNPRFAVFPNMESGVAASTKQLQMYQDKYGLKTIRQIVSRWAPPGENNTAAYIASVASQMGISPDAPLDTHNAAIAERLVSAMSTEETGSPLNPDTVHRGVGMAFGTPGAAPNPKGPYPAFDSANSNATVNAVTTTAGKLGMNASETEFSRLQGGEQMFGDALITMSSSAEKLNEAFMRLITTVGGLAGMGRSGGGAMPSGPRASAVAPASLPNPYDTQTLGLG